MIRFRVPHITATLVSLILTSVASPLLAQDVSESKFQFGLAGAVGGAAAVGDFDDGFEYTGGALGRVTFGGGAKLALFFNRRFALSSGGEVLGQGYRVKWDYSGGDVESRYKVLYLRVPLTALMAFDIGYQLGAGVAFDVGLKGWRVTRLNELAESSDWEDSRWENHRRFNIAAVAYANYVFERGPVALVPGFEFSVHLINDIKGDDYSGRPLKETMRHLNLMFVLGLLFSL